MWVQVPPRAHFKPSTAQQHKTTLAYVIGVALGDGNLSRSNGRCTRLRVTCDFKYPQLIKKIQAATQLLLPENKVVLVSRFPAKCVDISCYSNWWEEWLPWKVGQGSKVQQSVRVPDWIMQHEKYMKACLCGLIETDGSAYIDRGYTMVNFTTVIPGLSADVCKIIETLGFRPCVYRIKEPKSYKYVVRVAHDVNRFIQVVGIQKK